MSSHRHEVYFLNMITLVISLILSILISRTFAKKIINNIAELNRVTKKITNLDFSEKSVVNTQDELLELSKNINIMSDSLSSSINSLKTFVSNASHELKTPITVINSHAQLLLKGGLSIEDEKKYYRAILKESNSMNTLVQDLLLMSRLSAVGVKLEVESLDFMSMLKESIEKYEFLELQKDIEWEIKLNKIKIEGNRKFFQIALNNIIQNALKYSPNESIIKIYEEGENIVFENPMYPLKEQELDILVEPFARGVNASELKIEGHGLGLSLIKKILELHGFDFRIEEKNNIFIFTLTYSCLLYTSPSPRDTR